MKSEKLPSIRRNWVSMSEMRQMLLSTITSLDELLSEGAECAKVRERREFDHLTIGTEGIVLFGAGNLGRKIQKALRGKGDEVVAFADNNPLLWGSSIEGIPVLSPQEAASLFGSSAAFVISIWGVGSEDRMASRARQLKDLGCRTVLPFAPLAWKHAAELLPLQMVDLPHQVHAAAHEIQTVYDLWADEFSRREFLAQLQWRLLGDFDAMADPVGGETYLPQDLFTMGPREVFVDCGAFDGDTIASFLSVTRCRFSEIVAFEPDPENYQKLNCMLEGLDADIRRRIATYRQAVGQSSGIVTFDARGTDGSAIGAGDSQVECITLDEVLRGRDAPTFIKMDIEGAEPAALCGAARTIGRCAPILAICAYHQQDHLWRIPALIHSLNRGYKLYLRPHRIEGWDAVCYAVPPERAIS
jgi:FkbM family methyltransferase